MVRLKAKAITIHDSSRQISIPYGAIKRFAVRNLLSCQTEISIPYGAIKRPAQMVQRYL